MIRGTLDNRRRTPEQCHICEFTFSKVLTSIKSNAIMRKKKCWDLLHLNLFLKRSQSSLIRMILLLELHATTMLSNFKCVWRWCGPCGWCKSLSAHVQHRREKRSNITERCHWVTRYKTVFVLMQACMWLILLWQWCTLCEKSRWWSWF